jgi:TolB-like protein/Tfp pilus assembly protein PilF
LGGAERREFMLELSLLGGFDARTGPGEPIVLPTRKARALLAYLALHPDEAVSRHSLAALLWSDRAGPQANNSLSQAVSAIRKAFAGVTPSPLVVRPDSLTIEGAAVAVDVLAFDTLSRSDDLGDLGRAESLYRGELLQGIGVRDPAFEDWLEFERRRLHALAVGALTKLLALRRNAGQRQELVATAERLLTLDPLQEAAHRALMQCYGEQGQIGLAMAQYETCAEVLKRELDVEPDAETKCVREAIVGERPASSAVPIGPENAAGVEPGGTTATAAASSAEVSLALPDKPSIAVLPFTNMSNDPEQEFFADGITEDIVTALSKVPKLFVVARSSTFTYKGQAVDVKRVGQEQGVQYVLEGSVRRSGDRLRISAQLIHAGTGRHLWAQRYDRVVDDVFALQDEIMRAVILELQVKLTEGEQARLWASGTQSLEAWELVNQAGGLLERDHREDIIEVRRLIDEALRFDGNYAIAHNTLGWAHWAEACNVWSESPEKSLESALTAAKRSLAIDPSNPNTHALLAMVYVSFRDYDLALAESEKATILGPNNSNVIANAATVAYFCDKPGRSLELLRRAMRLCPVYPAWYLGELGEIYWYLEQLDEAINCFRKSIEIDPDYIHARLTLAISYAEEGRLDDARAAAQEVLRIEPSFTISDYAKRQPYRNEKMLTRMIDGLHSTGLPD